MPFSFTFKLVPPGLSNPFSALTIAAPAPRSLLDASSTSGQEPKRRRRSPGPSLSSTTTPISRKRGWQPSFAEPIQSTTTVASTGGYLDTPAKYRDMAGSQEAIESEYEEIQSDLPPTKRRRTLAGSIVSTALSAALIGTAVGLTVYRLWRNRSKEPEQIAPPPPYQQGEWVPVPQPQPQNAQVIPATPRNRKPRHLHSSGTTRRSAVQHRRPRPRASPFTPSPTRPEFDFARPEGHDDQPDVEDQMDWIGDKLSMLIEQGKKALGTEVVVMSDAKEDEVDDGTGAWEEDTVLTPSNPAHSPGSLRRSHTLAIPSPTPRPSHSSHSLLASSPSTRSSRFDRSAGLPISPPRTTRGLSVESDTRSNLSYREDERAWESPELRESMEKARARFLRDRGT